MAISRATVTNIERASWIRRVFDEGLRLKAELGEDEVCDFSLGNPSVEPPELFYDVLLRAAADRTPGRHRYMPNAGYPWVREAIARRVSERCGREVPASRIVLCSGAGAGLNLLLKTLLDPGDEVIVLAPYFLEYVYYVENYGGVLVEVPTDASFLPDVEAIAAAIGDRTKAILVNSPNNPTGVVYPRERLAALGAVLGDIERASGREIYLIFDEPYRHLVYDEGVEVPWAYDFHRNAIVVTSHSKDLGLAGERIGWVAVGPECEPGDQVVAGMIFALRALGFVNAPALMQHVVPAVQDACVDLSIYRRNRDLLAPALREMGYELQTPAGAFYLFPKSPLADEVEFTRRLRDERVLVVPGRGFGTPGHFRISYAVELGVCERALPGFERAIRGVQ